MDLSDPRLENGDNEEVYEGAPTRPRQLPPDLPKSLDDRQPVRSFGGETEMYDAWQGRVRISGCFKESRVRLRDRLLSWIGRFVSVPDRPNSSSAARLQPLFGRP